MGQDVLFDEARSTLINNQFAFRAAWSPWNLLGLGVRSGRLVTVIGRRGGLGLARSWRSWVDTLLAQELFIMSEASLN